MDRLKSLEIFKSVVDKGSFVKGAEALDISCSAASRAVQELETSLGVRLLQRSSRRIALTTVGHTVLQRSAMLIAQYRELEAVSSLSVSEAAGSVKLVAPVSYVRQMLVPALASFRMKFPRIVVDLRVTEDNIDVIGDEADLALCVGRDLGLSMVARRIVTANLSLYAAPSYVARRGAPRHPSDLAAHDCLTCEGLGPGVGWEFQHALTREQQVPPIKGVLHSNNAETVTSAALHGAGVVLLPDLLAFDLVRQGRLQPVMTGWHAEPLGVFLAYSSREHQPVRVRKLIDHLLASMPHSSSLAPGPSADSVSHGLRSGHDLMERQPQPMQSLN
jgi:DNA-binding transcriptional LysR family regulator